MVFVIILGCLFPLAVYCLFLAAVNRGRRPVLIPGEWDFAGLLFGVSGFLLLAGPFVLVAFQDRCRERWLYDRAASADALAHSLWHLRLMVWGGYFALVVTGAAWGLWRGRRITSIYHCPPQALPDVLAQACRAAGITPRLKRHRLYLVEKAGEDEASIRIADFARMRHATLHWSKSSIPRRPEIEHALADCFRDVEPGPNRAGTWFLAIAGGLAALIIAMVAALATLSILVRWRLAP